MEDNLGITVINPEVESEFLASRICYFAENILAILLEANLLMRWCHRAFILALWRKGEPTPFIKTKVGTNFPSDDGFRENCWFLAEEKISRQLRNSHISSFQSRNFDQQEYGGAIAIPVGSATWNIGIEGFYELEDEALAILIAIYVFKIPLRYSWIQEILDVKGNHELTEKLLAAVIAKDGGYYEKHIRVQ
ncbi:MAG: hypothetical protein WAV73_02150 [Candidatus Moraniibacteriota bacterium]